MRWFLIFLGVCFAIAALKYAIIALALVLIISVIWAAITQPAELLGTVALFVAANLLMTHTAACFTLIGFLGFWLIVRRPDPETDRANQDQSPSSDENSAAK